MDRIEIRESLVLRFQNIPSILSILVQFLFLIPDFSRVLESWSFGRLRPPLQLISSSRGGSPGRVSGARWTQGGTGLPGQSTAMRQRWPVPKGKGCAPGLEA
jgi:hypothetical protein